MKENPFCSDICKNLSSIPKQCKGCDYLAGERNIPLIRFNGLEIKAVKRR